MNTPCLECISIGKVYSRNNQTINVLTDINLSINKNESLLIKGRSGAGKSTLLNIMSGLIRPSIGKVFINGNCITEMNNASLSRILLNEIGIIFQSFNLLPTYTILENIEFALSPKGTGKKEFSRIIMPLLEKFSIRDKADRLPSELSVGQQQKAAIVRTLVKEPSIIFADEPTGSVDEITATEILDHLINLKNERDVTLIMASHGNIPNKYIDRIIVIENGQIKS